MTSRTFRWILCFVTLWIVLNVVVLYHMTKEARKVEWSVRGSLDRFFPSSSSGSSPAPNIAPTTSSRLPPSQKREERGEPRPGQKQKDIATDDEEGGEHESPDDPEEDHSGSDTGGDGGGDIGVERHTHHHHQHDTKHQEEDHREHHNSPKDAQVDPTIKKKNKVQRSKGNSVAAAPTTPHEILRRALPGGVTASSHERAAIAFLLVGDWGGPGRPPQKNVAKAMDTIASRPNGTIDFVISTGDNMYEDGVENEFSKKFQRNFESVYTYPSLQCRWYMSFGNHDHGAHGVMRDAQGEVNYTKHSTRWFLPSTYYKQSIFLMEEGSEDDNGGAADDRRSKSISLSVDLFVLDTYDYSPYVTQMTAPQLQWFEESLQQSKAQVKLVVGHRPMFSAGAKHGSSPYMRKTIEPLLKKYGVAAYMCGDDHELQVLESEGVLHLLSGGGARAKHDLKKKGVPQTIFQSGVNGFMRVEVSRSTVVVQVFDQFAVPLYDLTFPVGSLEEGKRLREKQVLLP